MKLEHAGRYYEIYLGSTKNGWSLELRDITEKPWTGDIVIFTFRSDVDGSWTFSAHIEDLPFDVVEFFVKEARRRLASDGTENSSSIVVE